MNLTLTLKNLITVGRCFWKGQHLEFQLPPFTYMDWFFSILEKFLSVGYLQNKTKDNVWPLSVDRYINEK